MAGPYLPRVADGMLTERLARMGAVVIEGARACGKTATAERQAASQVRFDVDETARETARIAPANVLDGATPRLLDEWQLVPDVWNAVRRAVDARGSDGQFILTGSSTPADDTTRHTGAGRFSRLRMRTLSLAESGLSSQGVSLAGLLAGEPVESGQSSMTLDDLIAETCHGGWPADRQRDWTTAQRNLTDHVNEIADADIRTVDGVRHDPVRVLALMRALARATATEARHTVLAADAADGLASLDPDTSAVYLAALRRLMIVEPLTSWSPVLRSKARLRRSVKHHFVDPAVSAALLNAGVGELRRDLKTYGFLFESLAIRDLRVYAEAAFATVHHYRDSNDLEVDAVVDGGHGRWAAFEIKLASARDALDKAATTLLTFAATVDTQSSGAPKALVILTAGPYAHTRPDGVAVVPLAALGA